MRIRDVDRVCIVDIAGKAVSQSELIKLKKLFKDKASKMRIGINLENVSSIDYDFISFLQECAFKQKLSICSLKTDVYLFLFVSKADRYVDIYLNEDDLCQEKRSIVNRRLKLLKSA